MKTHTRFCKENRRKPTPAEKEFRKELQRHRIKFRSQRPCGRYIVDFLLPLKRVVIEIDGGYHLTQEQQAKDSKRQRFIESKGFTVFRLTNDDVLTKSDNHRRLLNEVKQLPDIPIEDGRLVYGRAAF